MLGLIILTATSIAHIITMIIPKINTMNPIVSIPFSGIKGIRDPPTIASTIPSINSPKCNTTIKRWIVNLK
jgi:hypothetical protein